MVHWPRKDVDLHMWALPNYDGDFNVGFFLKEKGQDSFEYFKQAGYEVFRDFMYKHYPDTKSLIPDMKTYYDNMKLTYLYETSCSPWKYGKF